MKEIWVKRFVISTFVVLYAIVSIISTIHVIDFFEMSNPYWLAVSLAIAFEFGAAASLASLVALDKMNKTIVWILFFVITAMQMQGNMYYAFTNLKDYQSWIELFNLVEEDPLFQKRVLAFVSGAILPLVALGFIKSLVDYIKPDVKELELEDQIDSMRRVVKAHDNLAEEIDRIKEESVVLAADEPVESIEIKEEVVEQPIVEEEVVEPETEDLVFEDTEPVILNEETFEDYETDGDGEYIFDAPIEDEGDRYETKREEFIRRNSIN